MAEILQDTEHSPCLVCADHPGWRHGDESRRREPADLCRACYGSGREQQPRPVLARVFYHFGGRPRLAGFPARHTVVDLTYSRQRGEEDQAAIQRAIALLVTGTIKNASTVVVDSVDFITYLSEED